MAFSKDRILLHLITMTPALPESMSEGTPVPNGDGAAVSRSDSMDCKVHVSVFLDFPTAALMAKQLAAAARARDSVEELEEEDSA